MKDEFLDLINDDGSELSGCGRKSKRAKRAKRLSGIRGGKGNLTKADVTKYAAQKCGITQQKAKCVIDSTFEFIKQMLHGEEDACVTISKFGTFRTRKGKYNLNGKKGTYEKLTFKASK